MGTSQSRYPPWYRRRKYIHFDAPLGVRAAEQLVTDPSAVARRSFFPLISFRDKHRKWKKEEQRFTTKSRPIAYASHADSHIYAYYGWQLTALFEQQLANASLTNVVLAYRKHPLPSKSGNRGKTNFHFAAEAFADIVSRDSVEAIALDIEKFFDRIPHRELKRNWRWLLEAKELPDDHYAVYKAVTQFSCVPLNQLRRSLNLGRRRFSRLRSAGLSTAEFDTRIRQRGIINVNRDDFGIPQGLPISGLLANLVMFHIDAAMTQLCHSYGATYRRYSDDILIVAPPSVSHTLENRLKELLSDLRLCIQERKTQRVKFTRQENGSLTCTTPLQYLGMEFDGQRVVVRPETLIRFSKRMKRGVTRAANAARKRTPPGQPVRIRRRDLYARLSHLLPHRETPPTRKPRGSFMKYARQASEHSRERGLADGFVSDIRAQLRGQWPRLLRLLNEAEQELNRVRH